jgi:hypothetical protein
MPEMREVYEMVTEQTEPDVDSWREQERLQRRKSRDRKLGALAVAAVFVAALILAIRFTSEDQSQQPVDQPTSRSVPDNGSLKAGTYDIPSFEPVVTFTVDPGWWVGWDYGDGIHLAGGALSIEKELGTGFVRISFWDTTTVPFFYDGEPGPAPQDFAAYFSQHPSGVRNLEIRDTAVDVLSATRLDFEVVSPLPDVTIGLPDVPTSEAGFVWNDLDSQHWIVVHTPDGQLLINWTIEEATEDAESLANAERYFGEVMETVKLAERP